jgi:hypothetical protein
LAKGKLSRDPQVSKDGLRASDKGFLDMGWAEYIELLRWTARQKSGVSTKNVPPKLAEILTKVGIEASMWRDLVWNYKRYFGRSSCAGTPQSMAAHAERHNKNWHPGQRMARGIFVHQ